MRKSSEQNTYDAIVVGSGISGGWAAKELCEKGLKVLMLERGNNVEHPNYPTATKNPWDFPYRLRLTQADEHHQIHREPVSLFQKGLYLSIADSLGAFISSAPSNVESKPFVHSVPLQGAKGKNVDILFP